MRGTVKTEVLLRFLTPLRFSRGLNLDRQVGRVNSRLYLKISKSTQLGKRIHTKDKFLFDRGEVTNGFMRWGSVSYL
jgi:hypothetical protein